MIDEPSVFRRATPRRPGLATGSARGVVVRDEEPDDADLRHCLRNGVGVWLERAIRRTFLYSFDG